MRAAVDRRRSPGRRVVASRAACVAAVLLLFACAGDEDEPAGAPQQVFPVSATFVQYDYEMLAGFEGTDTPHGGVFIAFNAPAGVLFANVAAEIDQQPTWLLENWVMVTCGGPRRIFTAIDLRPLQEWLGVDDVQSIRYACTLTSRPRQTMPRGFTEASVASRTVRFVPGVVDSLPLPVLRLPTTTEGARLTFPPTGWSAVYACHASYPNQECGLGECAPAAVSNGLKFLAAGTGQNDIEDCWYFTDFDGDSSPWEWGWRKKERSLAVPYGVTTTVRWAGAAGATRRVEHIREAIQAIRDGKAVELCFETHVAALVAAAEVFVPDGSIYVFQVVHDVEQGTPGGTVVESVSYDPVLDRYLGGTPGFIHGSRHEYFVIQSLD